MLPQHEELHYHCIGPEGDAEYRFRQPFEGWCGRRCAVEAIEQMMSADAFTIILKLFEERFPRSTEVGGYS